MLKGMCQRNTCSVLALQQATPASKDGFGNELKRMKFSRIHSPKIR